MKKLVALLIFVIIAVTLVITCPDKEQHLTALNNEWTSYMDEKRMEEDAGKQTDDDLFKKGLNLLIYSAAGGLVKAMFEQQLIVKNNFIYSTGEINTDEGPKVVSLGLLGHVFVFLDAEKIKEGLVFNK